MDPLLDTAPCGFLVVTDDGHVVEANATLGQMLRLATGAIIGSHVDKLFAPASRIFYQTHVFPTLKLQGTVHEVYVSFRDSGGDDVPVMLNAARKARDERFVSDWVVVPMRQRNEYENEILKARKVAETATRTKDEFLAVVSHELRSPLSAISGWAHLLAKGGLDAAATEKAFAAIERNVKQQAKLVDDILDFGRMMSGKLRLDVAPLDLAPIVEAVVEGVMPAAQAKSIRVDMMLDSAGAFVSGDADRIQQVLWNMLTNAVKFTPNGGRVQVRLSRVNSSVEICVSDTGKGIAPEFLPHVFDRFRQEESGTRREGGLGLGMSITSQLVELHGGTIRAESGGAGKGATFIVKLPVMLAHEHGSRDAQSMPGTDSDAAAPSTAPSLAGIHVLVVDNEVEARDLLHMLLGRAGAIVRSAANVNEALSLYRQQRPHLLLSDIEMEGGDGYALIRRIREIEQGSPARTPAIALSARTRSADRLRALAAGFQLHLPKPVDPVELVVAIANLAEFKAE
jgi:signal transduction histidine kinase/ActR/RegA family two-component response regulator